MASRPISANSHQLLRTCSLTASVNGRIGLLAIDAQSRINHASPSSSKNLKRSHSDSGLRVLASGSDECLPGEGRPSGGGGQLGSTSVIPPPAGGSNGGPGGAFVLITSPGSGTRPSHSLVQRAAPDNTHSNSVEA